MASIAKLYAIVKSKGLVVKAENESEKANATVLDETRLKVFDCGSAVSIPPEPTLLLENFGMLTARDGG